MKNYENVYEGTQNQAFSLATGYISTTEIYVPAIKTVLKITASGEIEFLNQDESVITKISLSPQTGGREVYEKVNLYISENILSMEFPIVKWIDNYPHCDGEHDRWDSVTIGYMVAEYDILTKQTTTFEKEV